MPTDSAKSLDRIRPPHDTPPMEQMRSSHFERRDPARNMKRFYRLTVIRDLFGRTLLVREWGRIGTTSQRRIEEKPTLDIARHDAARLAAQKLRRGYVPIVD